MIGIWRPPLVREAGAPLMVASDVVNTRIGEGLRYERRAEVRHSCKQVNCQHSRSLSEAQGFDTKRKCRLLTAGATRPALRAT
jgi:hypothetical protein